jgi:hypothetical protein
MSAGSPAKIFCVGLSRTGTASLTAALETLGFHAKHFPFVHFRYGKILARLGFDELRLDEEDLRTYDAFADITVIPFYKQLDVRYPGSRFILTTRDRDSWLDSCERFPRFTSAFTPNAEVRALRRLVYGAELFDRTTFAAAHERHHVEVRAYFEERPGDLLVLDVCGGEGWEPLCAFLERPVPQQAFPRENLGPAAVGESAPAT